MQKLRSNEVILKKPSIAETLDWAAALDALGIRELTPDALRKTAGFVLKNNEDMAALDAEEMAAATAAAARGITMAEPDVYLEKLSAFSRMLHLENLSVSPKETEDAARLLIALGMDNRERVKTALRTVYAKSREEQITFDRVFDGFFLSEEQIRRQAKEQIEREQELAQHRKEAEEELQLNGQPMDLSEKQRETYAAMPEEAGSGCGGSWKSTAAPLSATPSSTGISSIPYSHGRLWSSRCSWKTPVWAGRSWTRRSAFSTGTFPSSRTRKSPKQSS